MEYDVYYSTGGGSLVMGGADVWVNKWIEVVAPHLKVTPKLLIHRNKPKQTQEQIQTFQNNVKSGRGGNTGRQVHKKIEKTYKEILNDDLEHYWQGDDMKKFKELLDGARRIHILHGYYAPHKYILDNKDKIHSNMVHVSVNDCLSAVDVLGLDKSFTFFMEKKWEDDICNIAKKAVWIGVNPGKIKSETIHIPNYYEFKHNKDVSSSNEIAFTSRMETRKCPHFLSGMKAKLLTDPKDIHWWKRNLDIDNSKWRVYRFNWETLDRFMGQDWGISHSAHIFEPFGYSIFQAVDWGKIPILAHDWLPQYDYPFRASTPEQFKEQYEKICNLSIQQRRDVLFPLRDYLKQEYGDKEVWREKLLEIYNN